MLKYNKNLKKFSQILRSNTTEAENKIWYYLRKKQILEVQFYRQKVIGNFIVDFYAPKAQLVIEIDGGQHFEVNNLISDYKRDECLKSLNLEVLRFDNLQVLQDLDLVLEVIYERIFERFKKFR